MVLQLDSNNYVVPSEKLFLTETNGRIYINVQEKYIQQNNLQNPSFLSFRDHKMVLQLDSNNYVVPSEKLFLTATKGRIYINVQEKYIQQNNLQNPSFLPFRDHKMVLQLDSVACYMNLITSVFSYKKPSFCQKDRDPFSFLWRITNRSPPSYLFGTIHVPYTEVWPYIPEVAKTAFAASGHLLLELDLVDPATVDLLTQCQLLPDKVRLPDVIPKTLFARLEKHMEVVRTKMADWAGGKEAGEVLFKVVAGAWRRKRPVWVMLMLDSLTEAEVKGRGTPVLDLFLAQEAEKVGMGTEAVEEVEEQCGPLNSLNHSQVLFALNHTLTQHELASDHASTSTTEDLIRHYNCGDLDSTVFGQDSSVTGPVLAGPPLRLVNASSSEERRLKEDEEEARSVDEYLRKELIHNRNKRMGSRVVQIMEKNPGETLFFAFGAGHFLGNNSVLDFLQENGFQIEHLPVDAKIPKSKPKKNVQQDKLAKGQTPNSEIIFSRKGQGRRSNRQRGPIIPSLLFDTSTPTTLTTQRTKSFNDLWVRLEGSDRKSRIEIHTMGEPRGPNQAFQKWYQDGHRPNKIPYSAGAVQLNPTQLLFIITIIYSCFSAFHIDLSAKALTGIT
ncbi:hypothetical protein JTE90_027722 [Oedothorax gibbosus]|uniref:Metalloprotease TIKI homolog n=1 Tax=Oedothorax gibbosus TaxID=931172 RepID=A0AAV6UVW6_9ARAC|nr:hypothetical protein JTE90_027722 [Oedothorax gibbosus]